MESELVYLIKIVSVAGAFVVFGVGMLVGMVAAGGGND